MELDRRLAAFIIDRVGQDQQFLLNEIKKISLYNKKITKESIILMTQSVPRSSIFNLLDAITKGKPDAVSKLYDEQRSQGMEPRAIMGMLAWQLNILSNIVAAPKDAPGVIAKRSKLSPFVVKKNMDLAMKLSKAQLIDMLDSTIESDINIKSGKSKPDTEVHHLLLDLTVKALSA